MSVPNALRAIATRVFPARTIERVIDPILADMQCEYDKALVRGGARRARWSLVRSYIALGRALVWLGVDTAWHADHAPEFARTCLVSALASALVTVPFVMPALINYPGWRGDPAFAARLFLTLIPQALPLSLPAGLCVAVLWVFRGKATTWRRTGMVLAIALASTAAVWVVLEWIMPEANQAFREMVAARISNGRVVTLQRGLAEMGLSRLAERSDSAAVRQYQLLWSLCCASVPLGLLALGMASSVRRAASAVVLAIALSTTYYALLWTSEAMAMTPWTPNVILAFAGCALLVRGVRHHPA